MTKNRYITLAIGLLVLLQIAFFVWYYSPRPINKTFHGILYQLGTTENVEQKIIHIKGSLKRNFNETRTFTGFIDIEGEKIPVPNKEITIRLDSEYGEDMRYYGFHDGEPYNYYYGTIFINRNFTQLTITKPVEVEPNRRRWNGSDGFMITAPAKNRTDAIKISNELMKNYLRGYTLD